MNPETSGRKSCICIYVQYVLSTRFKTFKMLILLCKKKNREQAHFTQTCNLILWTQC